MDAQMDGLDQLDAELSAALEAAGTLDALETVRIDALGKSGKLTLELKKLGQVDAEARKVLGPRLNGLRDKLNAALIEKKALLEEAAMDAALASQRLDLSLPARPVRSGAVHPTCQVFDELFEIFGAMGFAVADGPDIETDFNNFTALNFPPDHPARDHHDTFFFSPDATGETKLLRTHTSPVQIRSLIANGAPIRIIAPGRTYRCDSDQTHTPMFHQLEGLVIDRDIHFGHLKGCLQAFVAAFFETDVVQTRFRPHHFPFTEPSAEMDIGYTRVGNELRIGGSSGNWLEILGCGMVHPHVLKNCGLNPDEWQGFAFGLGVDRLAMLKYGIPDLRDMFAGEQGWLRHYGFSATQTPSTAGGLS